jgi:hypothetical protein
MGFINDEIIKKTKQLLKKGENPLFKELINIY